MTSMYCGLRMNVDRVGGFYRLAPPVRCEFYACRRTSAFIFIDESRKANRSFNFNQLYDLFIQINEAVL